MTVSGAGQVELGEAGARRWRPSGMTLSPTSEGDGADGDVDPEDGLPAGPGGQGSAEQDAGGDAEAADRTPQGEALVRCSAPRASPCGVRSAASASPPASCSAARSPPGPAGSSSSGSTSPSASSPSPLGLKVLPKDVTARADLAQFDLPGALTVIGGLAAVMYGLASTSAHGWLSARALVAFAASAVLLAAFVRIERRAARPLVPPHTWKVTTLVSGTTVMLGATALLVGTVFLTSIFFQTVLGYSALRAGVAFLPLALAITAGTHLASKLLARDVAAQHRRRRPGPRHGRRRPAVPGRLARAASRPTCCPAWSSSGSASAWSSSPSRSPRWPASPPSTPGMASGFLMTGHEVGAALGVAVLSAVATAAGSLTDPAGVVDGFSAAFVAAAVLAAVVGVVAYLRMPAARMTARRRCTCTTEPHAAVATGSPGGDSSVSAPAAGTPPRRPLRSRPAVQRRRTCGRPPPARTPSASRARTRSGPPAATGSATRAGSASTR